MWAKTFAGTDKSDMSLYLVPSDLDPFPFQSGRIMAKFQSVWMTLYFQMSVQRGSRQLMMGGSTCSSAVIPHIPGARFFFSFRIAADISSAVCGVESTEGSGVALAASAMGTGSSGGAGLLNCSWKWSFHLWSWSVSSQTGVPSLVVTGGMQLGCSPTCQCADTVEHCTVSSAIRVFCLVGYAAVPGGLISS